MKFVDYPCKYINLTSGIKDKLIDDKLIFSFIIMGEMLLGIGRVEKMPQLIIMHS